MDMWDLAVTLELLQGVVVARHGGERRSVEVERQVVCEYAE
jgi:hypothetical protein